MQRLTTAMNPKLLLTIAGAEANQLRLTKETIMRSMLKNGMFVLMLTAMPVAAQAGTLEGVAIGAGSGAVIAGPPGAVVGGVIGGVVGGPDLVGRSRHRHCWINDSGNRRCAWR